MSSLQRYRKPGGFLQLVSLIETFPDAKRARFLDMIETESAAWAGALRDKMLTIERVSLWPDEALGKIFKTFPPKSQAYALAGFDKDLKDRVWRGLPLAEQRRLTDIFGENNPKADEINSILIKFVETARRMLIDRELSTERLDANLLVSGDIEARLDGEPSPPTSDAGDQTLRAALKDARRENQTLRDEVNRLRDKIEQIKRVAA